MYKSILSCLFFVFIFSFSAHSQKAINQFFYKYRPMAKSTKFTVPGWLIGVGTGIAKTQTKDEDAKEALRIVNGIKKMRLLVIEEDSPFQSGDVKQMIKSLKKDGFEELISVKEDETDVRIVLREKKDEIRNLLIVVSEPDEFVMVSLKTKLKLSDLKNLIQKIEEDVEVDIDEEAIEEKKDTPLIRA